MSGRPTNFFKSATASDVTHLYNSALGTTDRSLIGYSEITSSALEEDCRTENIN